MKSVLQGRRLEFCGIWCNLWIRILAHAGCLWTESDDVGVLIMVGDKCWHSICIVDWMMVMMTFIRIEIIIHYMQHQHCWGHPLEYIQSTMEMHRRVGWRDEDLGPWWVGTLVDGSLKHHRLSIFLPIEPPCVPCPRSQPNGAYLWPKSITKKGKFLKT